MSDKYLPNVGALASDAAQRDAIHIAVAPVTAAQTLQPGQRVEFAKGSTHRVVPSLSAGVGIVDPFLGRNVGAERRFWLFLLPNTITALRHEWEHPAFDPPSASLSENWIRNFAASIPLDYDVLMSGAREWVRSQERGSWGEYLVLGGLLEGESVPDEFWPHYERVTGKAVAEAHRQSFFSCSC